MIHLERALVTRNLTCHQSMLSQVVKTSLTQFYHQESGLKLENILSNMLVISPHLELMLQDLEKCSIKNLWKDKQEKVESAQLEKSSSHNALMR